MYRHPLSIDPKPKKIRRGHIPLGGKGPGNRTIEVTNYYLERDGSPWFGVSGEVHYSRLDERFWETELIKVKMGGINLVSTYVFWIHHEEVQGQFEWNGRKNLRRFVELCARQGLEVIVRIGPFCHGEVRNGGLPDWLYGQPFSVRSNDSGYLSFVKTFFSEIGDQLKGLSFFDGGPIVGVQIENEYEHSAAPWEMTTAVNNEWTPGGGNGDDHLLVLKKMAVEAGILAPLYTCTAWGGAATPVPDVLPLWGGYAFQPWIFYGDVKEHPATPEFLFRDNHNNALPKTYNFEPRFPPEDYPYACCEMGGGMMVAYKYRFVLPPESVAAMAMIKLAGGCNFLGYYMYHGGTNPRGKRTPFLNEHQWPKMTYDFQTALGEFGQPRAQYHDLRLLHSFCRTFEDELSKMKTSLPPGAEEIEPGDRLSTRWSVRAHGDSGFLFWNNYQDHDERVDQTDRVFELSFGPNLKPIRIPTSGTLGLSAGASGFLPFRFRLGAATLEYATTQPITRWVDGDREVWFFQGLPGSPPEYAFDEDGRLDVVKVSPDRTSRFLRRKNDGSSFEVVTLTKTDARRFWKLEVEGRECVFLSSSVPLPGLGSPGRLSFETRGEGLVVERLTPPQADEPFSEVSVPRHSSSATLDQPFSVQTLGPRLAVVTFDPKALENRTDVVLRIVYTGDIGNAYIDGELVADNYANGAPWEIGLAHLPPSVFAKGLTIKIAPLKKGSRVINDTTMAGRIEVSESEFGEIETMTWIEVKRVSLELSNLL